MHRGDRSHQLDLYRHLTISDHSQIQSHANDCLKFLSANSIHSFDLLYSLSQKDELGKGQRNPDRLRRRARQTIVFHNSSSFLFILHASFLLKCLLPLLLCSLFTPPSPYSPHSPPLFSLLIILWFYFLCSEHYASAFKWHKVYCFIYVIYMYIYAKIYYACIERVG